MKSTTRAPQGGAGHSWAVRLPLALPYLPSVSANLIKLTRTVLRKVGENHVAIERGASPNTNRSQQNNHTNNNHLCTSCARSKWKDGSWSWLKSFPTISRTRTARTPHARSRVGKPIELRKMFVLASSQPPKKPEERPSAAVRMVGAGRDQV